MTLDLSPLWTLDQLSARVAQALMENCPRQVDSRVREVPDSRTIRYYTMLGLIDPPVPRYALASFAYGVRHLLQLVAIKRLQAKGLSLVEIQARLAGQTDAALRELAQLPADRQQTAEPAGDRRGGGFWGTSPSLMPEGKTPSDSSKAVKKNRHRDVFPWVGVPLDEGVILMLEFGRSLDDHDLEALRAAAAPLLKVLKVRRLKGS